MINFVYAGIWTLIGLGAAVVILCGVSGAVRHAFRNSWIPAAGTVGAAIVIAWLIGQSFNAPAQIKPTVNYVNNQPAKKPDLGSLRQFPSVGRVDHTVALPTAA